MIDFQNQDIASFHGFLQIGLVTIHSTFDAFFLEDIPFKTIGYLILHAHFINEKKENILDSVFVHKESDT